MEPAKVLAAASEAGVTVTTVLTTHKHWDHAGGNNAFHTQCPNVPIYGGAIDAVEGCTKPLKDGETLTVGKSIHVRCLHTPGHTMGHICYLATSSQQQEAGAVFTGDTLFIGGAGKFFEGTPQDMHTSLYTKLATLPPATQVWCGHEYTLSNYRFAEWMEPKNAALLTAITEAKARRAQGLPTVPSTIGQELATNPFMRVGEAAIQVGAGLVERERGGKEALRAMCLSHRLTQTPPQPPQQIKPNRKKLRPRRA